MAKKRNKKYKKSYKRDSKPITKRQKPLFKRLLKKKWPGYKPDFTEIEDFRKMKLGYKPWPKTIWGTDAKISLKTKKLSKKQHIKYVSPHLNDKLGFEVPKDVLICRRRKKRRETLFKMAKAGKGKSIRTKKRRNEYSYVRC